MLEVIEVLSTSKHALSKDMGTLPTNDTREGQKIRDIFTREAVDGQVSILLTYLYFSY